MEAGNIRWVRGTLDEAAGRAEQMPFCAEREAVERERAGRQARALSLLIRAGVREAIAMFDLENEWRRRQRPNRPS